MLSGRVSLVEPPSILFQRLFGRQRGERQASNTETPRSRYNRGMSDKRLF